MSANTLIDTQVSFDARAIEGFELADRFALSTTFPDHINKSHEYLNSQKLVFKQLKGSINHCHNAISRLSDFYKITNMSTNLISITIWILIKKVYRGVIGGINVAVFVNSAFDYFIQILKYPSVHSSAFLKEGL